MHTYKQIIKIYIHHAGIWIILDQTMVWTIKQSIIITAGFTGANNPPDSIAMSDTEIQDFWFKKNPMKLWKTTVNTNVNP